MAGDTTVNLERFWLPLGSSYWATSAGWLGDPRDGGLWSPNAGAVVTADLADQRCLVLLGEPGMGKTSTVAQGAAVRPQVEYLEEFYADLGHYSSEEGVIRRVFDSQRILNWRQGSSMMCLTLDGFDEGLSRIETLDRLLADYLNDWDCERLYLRVVCRTADWPGTLRKVLERHFGEVDLRELLPLRRDDADLLLRSAGVDAADVLLAIEDAGVVPLAARPLTLRLIKSAVTLDGSVPGTARDLYRVGLAALLDETPERQVTIHLPDAVTRRNAVAERVAAISIFSGRATIWTGQSLEAAVGDLTKDECIPPRTVDAVGVSSDDVRAALRSGVFTGAGENRLTWAHATFADYLAARWILNNELNDAQVESLLVSNDGRIYNGVRQVAAWLVAMVSARFQHLVERDPTAFLGVVDLPEESLRETMVRVLFKEVEAGRLYDDYDLDYSGLRHSALADQLRVALRGGVGEVCRVAVHVARKNSLTDALPDLTALALDEKADVSLRASAALAVHDLAKSSPVHDLTTIIGSSPGDIPVAEYRELEAAALMASWPHAISTEDVFAVLAPAHRRNFYGVYSIFIDHFAERLRATDLEPACQWLLADVSRAEDSRLEQLVTRILRLSVENLDQPLAREVVTSVVLKRIRNFESPFGDRGTAHEQSELDTPIRRRLVTVLMREASEKDIHWFVHQLHGEAVVRDDDLAWLIECYVTSDGTLAENIGHAARALYRPESEAHSSIVLGLDDAHPAASLFADWRTVIELDSKAAAAARARWQEHAQMMAKLEERRKPKDADAWVNPRIAEGVASALGGDTTAFWQAARWVTVRPGTESHWEEFQPDLTRHPRWGDLAEHVKTDMVAAARIYVELGECRPEEWFPKKDVVYFPAQAGYQALVLLMRHEPEALDQVTPGAWRKWSPILIDWSVTANGATEEDKRRLLELARPHAEAELRDALLVLVDRAIANMDKENEAHLFLATELKALSSDQLAQDLIERLSSPMAAPTRRAILDFLAELHPDEVTPLLLSWTAPQGRQNDPTKARDAVRRLIRCAARASWTAVRRLLDEDPSFMETALQEGSGFGWDRHVPDLAPADLADLYLWLCDHFPPEKDPQFEDVHTVSAREALGHWRDALLRSLQTAGTPDAVAAVARIAEARPDKPWLNRVLLDAKDAQREHSWEPLTTADLDQLAEGRRAHIVRTDADLLAVTLEALEEIQARLQADTPSAFLLWDSHSRRPKSEEEISDYLAIELEKLLNAQGVVVNREVQVRRIKPSGLPERTDLRIEALPPDSPSEQRVGTIRLPGEVKGAWHDGVIDCMSSQLVDRYMADFQTTYGLYIVAWFDQASWDENDRRRAKAAARGGFEELQAALEEEVEKQRALGRTVVACVLDCSARRRESDLSDD